MKSNVLTLLFNAVRAVESNNNPNAIRFEPVFYRRLIGIDKDISITRAYEYFNKQYGMSYISRDTVCAFLSHSVMGIQMMVYNLFFYPDIYGYINKMKIPIRIPMTVDISVEYELFSLFLKAIKYYDLIIVKSPQSLISDVSLLKGFSKRYNGSVDYYDKLIKALNSLRNTV